MPKSVAGSGLSVECAICLGSDHSTDELTLRLLYMGYYSRAKGKMQPFFVEERSRACRMNEILPERNGQRHAAVSGAPREEIANEIMARSG